MFVVYNIYIHVRFNDIIILALRLIFSVTIIYIGFKGTEPYFQVLRPQHILLLNVAMVVS